MSFFSFIGAADAYIDLLDDTGNSTGLSLQGNCMEFVPKPDAERKEITANGRSNWGQVLDSVTLPKPMTASIKFNQMSQELFAMMFFGTNADLAQTAGAISPAVSITAILDKWVDTGIMMLDTPVIKDDSDTTTYVENTDYVLNKRLGLIMALSTGSIANSDVLHMTGTKAVIDGTQTTLMTKSNVRIRVKLDGQNYADGRNFIADVYRIRLNPTSDFSLIGSEFAEASFEGVLETPTGETEPGKFTWLS